MATRSHGGGQTVAAAWTSLKRRNVRPEAFVSHPTSNPIVACKRPTGASDARLDQLAEERLDFVHGRNHFGHEIMVRISTVLAHHPGIGAP